MNAGVSLPFAQVEVQLEIDITRFFDRQQAITAMRSRVAIGEKRSPPAKL
jgi:hypothetical protein